MCSSRRSIGFEVCRPGHHPARGVCVCVLVSDVIYVTTAVRAADKLISCLRLPSPRPLLLDSWLVALVAAGPRNCILTRFLVCRMWRLTFHRRHLSDLHTLNHLRETSAALCRDEGSNFRSIKCETSSGSSEMISTLLGTNKPTTRSRDLKNSMLLLLLREHDWRSG